MLPSHNILTTQASFLVIVTSNTTGFCKLVEEVPTTIANHSCIHNSTLVIASAGLIQ